MAVDNNLRLRTTIPSEVPVSPATVAPSSANPSTSANPVSNPVSLGKFSAGSVRFNSILARPSEPVLDLKIGRMSARDAMDRVDEFGDQGLQAAQLVASRHPDVFLS